MSSCKVGIILVRLEWNLDFLKIFSKNNKILNFKKVRPVGAQLFHVGGRTDTRDEANTRFFATLRTPKIQFYSY
jgi:hypothetical protein